MPIIKTHQFSRRGTGALLAFSMLFFVFSLGDAIMSYVAPVFMEERLDSAFLMGLVMAASSVVGFASDALLGKYFGNRNYLFFVLLGCLLAIAFPSAFAFLPSIMVVFLLGMSIWGLYFELIEFSLFAYVESFHEPADHARVWGILSSFRSASYMVGPALATYSMERGENTALLIAAGIFGVSALFALIFRGVFGLGHHYAFKESVEDLPLTTHFSAVWVVFKRIWPVWCFTFVLYIVDATFWTTGTLFSEFLGTQHALGNLFMSIYMVPFILGGLMTAKLAKPFGKKRMAYLGGVGHGLTIILFAMMSSVPLILALVFVSAFFAAVAMPEILATAEDYVTRLKGMGSIMVSLELIAASLGYVFGPMLSGYLTERFSMQITFVTIGVLLTAFSFMMMLVTPRKIHLPQTELYEVVS